jgi:multiple sugar transport system substrate-binding protein
MTERHRRDLVQNRVTRRTLLRAAGGASAGAVLAAGGLRSGAAAPSSGRASTHRASFQDDFTFTIPDSGAQLPTDDVQLRWMDSGDAKAFFFEAFFPAYQEKHPNIEVQYDGTNWNQIQQVITLGFRNGSAPDAFQLPSTITMADAVNNTWIGALDDIVPNWAEVKARFPVGTFAPGVTDFNDKTYGLPATSHKRINNLLLYNADYLSEAGYDPSSTTLSWDECREAARKCTEQGEGSYYGLIAGVTQNNALPGVVNYLAEMAGAIGGEFNYQTGTYNYATDQYIGAIELILAIKADGSFFPGTASLDNPGARGRMPQGVAAMILQGPWNIVPWTQQNPDFKLGVGMTPQMNPEQINPISHGPGGSNTWSYFSGTQLGAVVGDIFSYMGTVDGQAAWGHFVGAADPPQFPEALEKIELDPLSQKALDLGFEWTRLRPEPSVRNPDVQQVYLEQKPLTPSWNDVMVGLFTDQLTDVRQAMQDLQDRAMAERERAIKAAQDKGAQVSQDDFVFADWDPTQDYTPAATPTA